MTTDETDFKVTKLRFLFGPTLALKETRAVSKNDNKERALTTPKQPNLVILHKYDSIPTVIGRMYQNGTHFVDIIFGWVFHFGYLFALKSNIHH